MKKILILSFAVCQIFLLSSCGDTDNVSSQNQNLADSGAIAGTENSESKSEVQISSVTVTMDNKYLHEGVDFTDSGMLEKTADFYKSVKENGEISEPESHEAYVGGNWMNIKLSDGSSIYFEDGDANYVQVGRETYYTEDGSANDYKQYMLDYLAE